LAYAVVLNLVSHLFFEKRAQPREVSEPVPLAGACIF
jgi:hypothetical protein